LFFCARAGADSAAQEPSAPDVPEQSAELESRLRGPLERQLLVRAVVQGHPGVRAQRFRADAARAMSESEAQLPAPEAMAEVWQIPFSRPYAIDDAGMIMLGVRQAVPAPGSRGARAQARRGEARARAAMSRVTARDVAREAGHAFVDYAESFESQRLYGENREVALRIVATAQARLAGGASLVDVAAAEAELARVESELVFERAAVESGRYRLNALLRRAPHAPLGEPVWTAPDAPRLDATRLSAAATAARPERAAAVAERDAKRGELRAREAEATWPSFSIAGLYFVPAGGMSEHAFGVSAAMSLPWLWGGARQARDAERALLKAAEQDVRQSESGIRRDVASALSVAHGAHRRLEILQSRVRPATERLAEAARAGYQSGGVALGAVLDAERRALESRMDIVDARAELEHALVDLEWAVGQDLVRAAATRATRRSGERP
jgi:outer membrane protein TolC